MDDAMTPNSIHSESLNPEKVAAEIVQRYWPNTATRYDADWRHNATVEIAAAIRTACDARVREAERDLEDTKSLLFWAAKQEGGTLRIFRATRENHPLRGDLTVTYDESEQWITIHARDSAP